ncbi:MAG TPA: hypothetical protein VFE48_07565 [Methylomirabilota bacterium]|nr:hypothetical protein [Methylomirabilota bacterium]
MPDLFVIGDETTHIKGDARCPECLDEYPVSCPCGGLIHAAAGEQDEAGGDWPLTRCDQCGRSEEELH